MESGLAQFNPSFVRLGTEDGSPVGAGFLVGAGEVLTCAHVVAAALHDDTIATNDEPPQETVRLNFHFLPGQPACTARVIHWWRLTGPETNQSGDIAVLKIDGSLPEHARAVDLTATDELFGREFRAHGFPVDTDGGVWAYGVVRDPIGNGWLQVEAVSQQGSRIERGFSGGPAQDHKDGRILGMVAAAITDKLERVGFFIPTQILREVWTPTRVEAAREELTPYTPPVLISPDPPPSVSCPFRDREAFVEGDAEIFFGRERAIEDILRELSSLPNLLTVLGPSGSGKTSLVQAGLIPTLREGEEIPGSDRWAILNVHQYEDPFEQLTVAGMVNAHQDLRGAAEDLLGQKHTQNHLLLVLDQFEELLLACTENVRERFMEQLEELLYSPSVTVIIVMEDSYHDYLMSEAPAELKDELRPSRVWLDRYLSKEELTRIVRGPVETVGFRYENDALAESIVNDAFAAAGARYASAQMSFQEGGRPEQLAGERRAHNDLVEELTNPEFKPREYARSTVLPLLEGTLTRLCDRCGGETLTREAYLEIGKLTGILNLWAEDAYRRLRREERPLARRILTQLAQRCLQPFVSSTSETCQPLTLAKLSQREDKYKYEEVRRMVHRLTKDRLLVTTADKSGEQNVEIIHSQLVFWRRLRNWLSETS